MFSSCINLFCSAFLTKEINLSFKTHTLFSVDKILFIESDKRTMAIFILRKLIPPLFSPKGLSGLLLSVVNFLGSKSFVCFLKMFSSLNIYLAVIEEFYTF